MPSVDLCGPSPHTRVPFVDPFVAIVIVTVFVAFSPSSQRSDPLARACWHRTDPRLGPRPGARRRPDVPPTSDPDLQRVFVQRASVPSSGIRPPRFYLISRVATLPLLALPSSTLRRTCIAAERNYASPPPHCPRLARRRAHGAARRRRRQRFGHVWAVRGCPRSLFGHARGCEYSMHMHMHVCVCV